MDVRHVILVIILSIFTRQRNPAPFILSFLHIFGKQVSRSSLVLPSKEFSSIFLTSHLDVSLRILNSFYTFDYNVKSPECNTAFEGFKTILTFYFFLQRLLPR